MNWTWTIEGSGTGGSYFIGSKFIKVTACHGRTCRGGVIQDMKVAGVTEEVIEEVETGDSLWRSVKEKQVLLIFWSWSVWRRPEKCEMIEL